MKLIKRNKSIKKHKNRYILLSVTIFSLVALLHFLRLVLDLEFVLGEIVISKTVSVFALFATASMAFMGVFYLLKK